MNLEENYRLGFWSMILLGVNGIVGSGIFLLPGTIMSLTGPWSLIIFLLVTVIVLAIAWCFAQCAALFNRNGGSYLYAKEAFGEFIGFEIGMMRWAVGIIAWASIVVGFITAISSFWPPILQEPVRSLFILGILGILFLVNVVGIKLFKHINNVITVAKLFPLLLFVLLGVFFIKQTHFTNLNWQDLDKDSFGSAALLLFYAFSGFEALVVPAAEMKNPRKNLPTAVMLVILFCSLLYFCIQLIAIGVLGESLAQSVTPLTDAARVMFGEIGIWCVTLAMLISMAGINLSASFVTPRVGAALAADGMIPRKIAHKCRFGTPIWAILLTTGLTALLALSGSFTQLVAISVVSRFAHYISTCLAVYILPRKMDHTKKSRSHKILIVIVPIIALTGIGWLMTQATFFQLISGLGGLALGVPLYLIHRTSNMRPRKMMAS